MDRAKSIVAKLLLHFPPHSRWVVFSSQSQYFAAFLINFSINLAMNFNHRTRQGEPGIVVCIGNTKATRFLHHSLGCWPSQGTNREEDIRSPCCAWRPTPNLMSPLSGLGLSDVCSGPWWRVHAQCQAHLGSASVSHLFLQNLSCSISMSSQNKKSTIVDF